MLEQAAEVTGHLAFVVGICRVTTNDRVELALIEPQPVAFGATVQFDGRFGPDIQLAQLA